MNKTVQFIQSDVGRMAYRFLPDVVRAFLPHRVIGSYALFSDNQVIYIGRSDHSLRARLSRHPLIGIASHFTWQICDTVEQAFYWEAAWYHNHRCHKHLLNIVHPGIPTGLKIQCPFCQNNDELGLYLALNRMLKNKKSA